MNKVFPRKLTYIEPQYLSSSDSNAENPIAVLLRDAGFIENGSRVALELAKRHDEKGLRLDARGIYQSSLETLCHWLEKIKRFVKQGPTCTAQQAEDLKRIFEKLSVTFDQTLKSLEAQPSGTPGSGGASCPDSVLLNLPFEELGFCAEESLYDYALQLARTAALNEMIHAEEENIAFADYLKSFFLLKYLEIMLQSTSEITEQELSASASIATSSSTTSSSSSCQGQGPEQGQNQKHLSSLQADVLLLRNYQMNIAARITELYPKVIV